VALRAALSGKPLNARIKLNCPKRERGALTSACFPLAFRIFTYDMAIQDLTVNQLKRAAAIKERVERLNRELNAIFGARSKPGAAVKKIRTMSAAVKRKIAAAQKARWATLRRAKSAVRSVQSVVKAKKKTMSRATRAKLRAKLKAYWAAKRAGKK